MPCAGPQSKERGLFRVCGRKSLNKKELEKLASILLDHHQRADVKLQLMAPSTR